MPNPMLAMMGISTIGGIASGNAQSNAASDASAAQMAAARLGIAEQRRQFNAMRGLLQPYVKAGNRGMEAQMALMGLSGDRQQRLAVRDIRQDPLFQAQVQSGENALLQNASATGGLRGGNTAAALAQFRPQMLSQAINNQMAQYGGLASMGQNAAAGVGNSGMAMGNNVANLLQQSGAAQAGGYLAQGQATANAWGNLAGGAGWMAGQFAPPEGATMFGKWGF